MFLTQHVPNADYFDQAIIFKGTSQKLASSSCLVAPTTISRVLLDLKNIRVRAQMIELAVYEVDNT
jgi:hypothetical protein